jgi:mRNA-degrading endonuclease RelE of RelBE toxin-antitoxin system
MKRKHCSQKSQQLQVIGKEHAQLLKKFVQSLNIQPNEIQQSQHAKKLKKEANQCRTNALLKLLDRVDKIQDQFIKRLRRVDMEEVLARPQTPDAVLPLLKNIQKALMTPPTKELERDLFLMFLFTDEIREALSNEK